MKGHYPCLSLAIIFAFGIMMAHILKWPLGMWYVLAFLAILLLLVFDKCIVLWVLVFCCGGVWMMREITLERDHIAFVGAPWVGKQVKLIGRIDSGVERKRTLQGTVSRFDLTVQILEADKSYATHGKVRVRIHADIVEDVVQGQDIVIKGRLRSIVDMRRRGFSLKEHLNRQGIFWYLTCSSLKDLSIHKDNKGFPWSRWAKSCRSYFRSQFKKYLWPREEAFVSSLVLGERTQLPYDIRKVFVQTGTAHILAISGMNMAVVTLVSFFLLRLLPLPRQVQLVIAAILVFAYAYLCGAAAPVMRAALMSVLILMGFVLEEEPNPLNSCGLAASVLLLFNPYNLFNIGFQLSFAAVFGILTLTDPITKRLSFLPAIIAMPIGVSLAAWVSTEPIIGFYFKIFSPIAILANLPIVPLADLIMLLGLLLALFGGWFPFIGVAIAACIKAVLSAMILLASWFASWPWAWVVLY